MSRLLTLLLVGSLITSASTLALADATLPGAKYSGSLIDQLDPNDPCAWWNTTNPNNCTGNTSSGITGPTSPNSSSANASTDINNDSWNWSGVDPVWNTGSDNSAYSNFDPNSNFSGFSGGGLYQPPQMGFLEKQMYSVLAKDYTAAVVQDMNGHGTWDSEALDEVADEIIAKYSRYSAAWGVMATGGIYVLDYLFLDKWRLPGAWTAASYVGMAAGSGAVMTGESFKVMQDQMSMVLELMELYGQLPRDVDQRANEMSVALDWSLGGMAAGTAINRMLALQTYVAPAAGAAAGAGLGAAAPGASIVGETMIGASGLATEKAVEKSAASILAKTGFIKAATNRFGATTVGKFMAEHSTFFKVSFATAFAAGINYEFTYHLGQQYKKNFRKIAQVHEHNVIESFKNDANAKQTVWLILTKEVFKPNSNDEALTPEEAKLYAAIVSQQIPLVHYGTHNEADSLFKQYKASAPPPPPVAPPKGLSADTDFGLGTPKVTTTKPNEIDEKLEILNVDLDLEQRLYLIKLVEGGMLMKGYPSARDIRTLETISVALNLSPPPKHAFKDSDIRQVWHNKYKNLRDGMNGEVNRKVLAFTETPKMEQNIPMGDLRNRSGEIIMEDFFKPEQVALRAWADRVKFSGVIEQKDYTRFDNIAPILEGERKVAPITKLPENTTADGSPRAVGAP